MYQIKIKLRRFQWRIFEIKLNIGQTNDALHAHF